MNKVCSESVKVLGAMILLGIACLWLDFYVLEGVAKNTVPMWAGITLTFTVGLYNVITIRLVYLLSNHFQKIQNALTYELAKNGN